MAKAHLAAKSATVPAPWPYGYRNAINSVGTVASPLLAGFSFTLIALVIPATSGIRWPGVCLVLFVVSGISFVMAVQCGFWAQMWVVMPSEIGEWTPTSPPERVDAELRFHAHGFKIWAGRVNSCYRVGLLGLLIGVMLILIPPGDLSTSRWIAVVAAALGVCLEVLWMASSWLLKGSRNAIYVGQNDVPKKGTTFTRIRGNPALRWIARRIEPIVREPQ
jgi:hypothetical protein